METGLQDKIALVTGSGRNIGKAIALGLAKEGVDVVINCAANRANAEETAEEVKALGVTPRPDSPRQAQRRRNARRRGGVRSGGRHGAAAPETG